MEYVLSLLWTLFEMIAYLFFFHAFFQRKKPWKKGIIWVIAVWLIVYCISRFVGNSVLRFMMLNLCTIGLSIILFEGGWFARIICALLSYLFGAVLDLGVVYGCGAILGISMEDLIWRKLLYTVLATMAKLLYVFVAYITYKLRRSAKRQTVWNKWLLLTVLFPTASIFMILATAESYANQPDISTSTVVLSGIVALANIAILYLISIMEKATKKEQEFRLLTQQMELQTKSILALEESYRAQRKATHEFNHQLQTLQTLIAEENYQSAVEYISQISRNPNRREYSVDTKNPIINAVLNQKISEAKEQNIEIQVQVNDISQIRFHTEAMVVLLTNLLDNAIEGCQRVEETQRQIHCRILAEETLYLSVRNTSVPVTIVDGQIATSKVPPQEHGYGLPAIYGALQLLKGESAIMYEDGWFQFAAELPASGDTPH